MCVVPGGDSENRAGGGGGDICMRKHSQTLLLLPYLIIIKNKSFFGIYCYLHAIQTLEIMGFVCIHTLVQTNSSFYLS